MLQVFSFTEFDLTVYWDPKVGQISEKYIACIMFKLSTGLRFWSETGEPRKSQKLERKTWPILNSISALDFKKFFLNSWTCICNLERIFWRRNFDFADLRKEQNKGFFSWKCDFSESRQILLFAPHWQCQSLKKGLVFVVVTK